MQSQETVVSTMVLATFHPAELIFSGVSSKFDFYDVMSHV